MKPPTLNKKFMRIGELVNTTGIPRSTIQFYLREELLHAPTKTGKTMAYYDASHLERLRTIQQLKQEQGLPLNFIKKEIETEECLEQRRKSNRSDKEDISETRNARRHEITKAAIQVFAKKGYYRSTIQDIAQSANISIGTFYAYFENKRELFMYVVDDVIRTIVAETNRAIEEEESLGRKLLARGEAFHEHYSQYNEIISQVKSEMAGDDRWPYERIKQIYKDLTEPVVLELEQMVDEKLARPMDKDLLAHALTGLIETMCLRMTFDDKYSIRDVLEFLQDFVVHGIGEGT